MPTPTLRKPSGSSSTAPGPQSARKGRSRNRTPSDSRAVVFPTGGLSPSVTQVVGVTVEFRCQGGGQHLVIARDALDVAAEERGRIRIRHVPDRQVRYEGDLRAIEADPGAAPVAVTDPESGLTGETEAVVTGILELGEEPRSRQEIVGRVDRIVPDGADGIVNRCLLYTSPSPRDKRQSRMPSSA